MGVLSLIALTLGGGCGSEGGTESSTGKAPDPSPSSSSVEPIDDPSPHILRSERVRARSGSFSIEVPSNWGYEQTRRRITVIAQQPASGTRIYIWQVKQPDPPPLSEFPQLSLANFNSNKDPRVRGKPRYVKIDGVKGVSWDVVLRGSPGDRYRYVDAIYKGYVIDIGYVPGVDATFSRELAILDRILESWKWT